MTDINRKALYIAQECLKAGMTVAGAAGVLANVDFILVCTYGCEGSDPELLLYKKR